MEILTFGQLHNLKNNRDPIQALRDLTRVQRRKAISSGIMDIPEEACNEVSKIIGYNNKNDGELRCLDLPSVLDEKG